VSIFVKQKALCRLCALDIYTYIHTYIHTYMSDTIEAIKPSLVYWFNLV